MSKTKLALTAIPGLIGCLTLVGQMVEDPRDSDAAKLQTNQTPGGQ